MKPLVALLFIVCATLAAEETAIEASTPMKKAGNLGTKGYEETEKEKSFSKKIDEPAFNVWAGTQGDNKYTLAAQTGRYAGWFGIVREIKTDTKAGKTTLLVEHKYFDGLTDLHIHIVSYFGAGDFKVEIAKNGAQIPNLGLVRVCGRVTKGADGVPTLTAEYVRTWDWGLFTFMDYGPDASNPKWVRLRKVDAKNVYSPRPDTKFYEDRIGVREK